MSIQEQRQLADANKAKYLKAPTFAAIESFIKELDVSDAQFERFFGIPSNTLTQVKRGDKRLPARFWHIIYEKTVPTYSIPYQKTEKANLTKKLTTPPKQTQELKQEDHLLDSKLNDLFS